MPDFSIKKIVYLGFALLGLQLLPLTLSAEEKDLGEIVVPGKTQDDSSSEKDVSAFVTVIRPEDYKGEFQTTSELLQKTVGVRVIDFGGLGQVQTVSIRGSSAEQVIVLLDGVRLNTAQRGGVNIASIPLEIIERIEVIRGGEAAVFGSDGIGGVVNIITKQGSQFASEPQTHISGTYGSFDTIEIAGSHGHKIGPFDYFLSHTHLQTEGDFPFIDTTFREQVRINNKSFSESPFIRLGLDVEGVGRFEVSDQYFYSERGQPGFGTAQLAFADSTEWRNLFSFRYIRKKFFWDQLDFQLNHFFRVDDFEFQDPFPRIGPPIVSDTRNYAYGGNLQWDLLLPPYQLLTFWIELRQDEAEVFSSSAAAVNFQNIQVERFTYALVLKDEIRFWQDRIALMPTLRYEDTTQTGGEIVPKFGVRVQALDWFVIKGNVSRVFRNPNFNELYFPESEYIGGNPFLVPEKGISGDAGFEILTKPFFFSATAFYTELYNAIFFVPISASRIEPINFLDDSISQGVELVAEWNPWEYTGIRSSYTFLDHFFQATQFRLPGRSVHNADFRVTLKYPPWIKFYVEGEYLSEFSVVLPAAGGILEPDRFILNTGIAVTPWEHITFSFDAKDVNNFRGIVDSRDIPLPERRFFGKVEVNF